jgi:glycosyltransferase involved in cell wall biosynthesis
VKINFLIHNVYGVGGTVRTVINLAHALSAAGHHVEIASVLRRRPAPVFDIDPAVTVRPLLDLRRGRPDRTNPLLDQPSRIVPAAEEFGHFYNGLTDERIARYLKETRADVVIGTRPSLNLCVARLDCGSAVRIAQEHMTHSLISPGVVEAMVGSYGRLDACVTVTEADARLLAASMVRAGDRPHTLAIPNSVPQPPVAPAGLDHKLVVAAGRVEDIKRYELLIQAFRQVADNRPDWRLRIYGSGTALDKLRGLVDELHLNEHVMLMGQFSPIDPEWVKGSIAAVTSDFESFGMTIVEAMRCGLPVVSTDCPVGPGEIIDDGVTGFLVPTGDVDAIAQRLLRLIDDDALRHRMGAAALEQAAHYDPAEIAARYVQLFTMLRRDRAGNGAQPLTTTQLRAEVAEAPRQSGSLAGAAVRPARKPTVIKAASNVLDAPPGLIKQLPSRVWRAGQVGRTRHGRRQLTRRARKLARTRLDDFWAYLDRAWSQTPPLTTIDEDGRIRLTLDFPATVRQRFELQCRLRGTQRWLHLEPQETQYGQRRRLSAVFPNDERTAVTGMWDLYLHAARGRRHRLTAGVRDLRRLLEPAGWPLSTPFTWHIPYSTRKGGLSIRSFDRPHRHAEVERLSIDADAVALSGTLYGGSFADRQPTVSLRHRQDPARWLCVTGSSSGGGDFAARIPLDRLLADRLTRHDDYDLWVSTGGADDPVRIEKILTDVPWKKDLFRFPNFRVRDDCDEDLFQEFPAPNVYVKPYLTPAEELSVVVSDK